MITIKHNHRIAMYKMAYHALEITKIVGDLNLNLLDIDIIVVKSLLDIL